MDKERTTTLQPQIKGSITERERPENLFTKTTLLITSAKDQHQHQQKIFHFVNLTNYYQTTENIYKNIQSLDNPLSDLLPLLDSTKRNFKLLKTKLDNLSPRFRNKRGLINGLGKGIKFITGNMDNDDENEIKSALVNLTTNINDNSERTETLARVSETLSSQIQNITTHINMQQYIISKYINKFRYEIQNKISTLEDEVVFLRHVYQIDSDINLLKDHIDDIGRVVFTSKLGVIPTDLLDEREIDIVDNFEAYSKTKIAVTSDDDQIIIILSIPIFSNLSYSQIILEPIPNKENKSLYLEQNQIIIDDNKNIYYPNVTNLFKNMQIVKDNCIEGIVRNNVSSCMLREDVLTEVKEIKPGKGYSVTPNN
ncbi:Retrovirus-related Env polyprotein from transposon 297 [Lucilia cuprina]|nr:Retrovirus-related Env polyprotein from transposon 297 [Lucilia cuprina]